MSSNEKLKVGTYLQYQQDKIIIILFFILHSCISNRYGRAKISEPFSFENRKWKFCLQIVMGIMWYKGKTRYVQKCNDRSLDILLLKLKIWYFEHMEFALWHHRCSNRPRYTYGCVGLDPSLTGNYYMLKLLFSISTFKNFLYKVIYNRYILLPSLCLQGFKYTYLPVRAVFWYANVDIPKYIAK